MKAIILTFLSVFAAQSGVYQLNDNTKIEFSVNGIEPPDDLVQACHNRISEFAAVGGDEYMEQMEQCSLYDADYLTEQFPEKGDEQ